jgi:NADH dehydrogenase (ubiquinone) 1 beta subcomplex subunit 11
VTGNLAFLIVAMISVIPFFIYNYCPDYQLKNWAHREAYLLLKEREDAGIFPISKDFIDPAKIELPSDEELGDIDVKI